jgi:uncharacterized membrane protein YedE/YeeE
MKLPAATQIDRRMVIGSAMFGIGWGIAGFCPGPALVGLGMAYLRPSFSSPPCWPEWQFMK